jgi:hypothetical protein
LGDWLTSWGSWNWLVLTPKMGEDLKQAALLFAARSAPTAKLPNEEKEAFESS